MPTSKPTSKVPPPHHLRTTSAHLAQALRGEAMPPIENPDTWTKCPWCEYENADPNAINGHAYKVHPNEMRAQRGPSKPPAPSPRQGTRFPPRFPVDFRASQRPLAGHGVRDCIAGRTRLLSRCSASISPRVHVPLLALSPPTRPRSARRAPVSSTLGSACSPPEKEGPQGSRATRDSRPQLGHRSTTTSIVRTSARTRGILAPSGLNTA